MEMQTNNAERNWEKQLQKAAAAFPYPPTPPIHTHMARFHTRASKMPALPVSQSPISNPQSLNKRRLALTIALLLFLLATLLAIPTTRAAIAHLLRAGAISIFAGEDALEPLPGGEEGTTRAPRATGLPGTPAAVPETALVTPAFDGPLTLRQAEEAVGFTLLLPNAASNLGPPDEIYVERSASNTPLAAVLIWTNPQAIDTSRLALYQIGVAYYGIKAAPFDSLIEMTINGQQAYWIDDRHLLQLPDGAGNMAIREVGNALIWTEGAQTYRLEGAPNLAAAVDIAHSLQPPPDE